MTVDRFLELLAEATASISGKWDATSFLGVRFHPVEDRNCWCPIVMVYQYLLRNRRINPLLGAMMRTNPNTRAHSIGVYLGMTDSDASAIILASDAFGTALEYEQKIDSGIHELRERLDKAILGVAG